MSEQLDYEATKAALRAQAAGSPRVTHGWRWTSGAGLVMVVCAVVATVWITREASRSEVVMVPSAGHDAAAHPNGSTPTAGVAAPVTVGRSADTAATVVNGSPLPTTAPEPTATGATESDNSTGGIDPRTASGPTAARDVGSVFVPQRSGGGGRPTSSSPGRDRRAPGQASAPGPATPTPTPERPAPTNEPTGTPSPTTGGGASDPGADNNPSGGGAGSGDSTG